MAQSRKQRRKRKAAKTPVVPVPGFKGGDPVAIGRLGGLAKGVNANNPMKRRVLVVDDEPSIVSTVCTILEAYGYDALGVNSGYEAIAKVAVFRPDLLLSDILMPGMNGFETGAEIKKLCPKCRLLFFTGYSDLSDMTEDFREHGHRFEVLSKPMQPAFLIEKIKARLAEES